MSNECRIEFPICKDHPNQYYNKNFAVPEDSNIFLKTMSFAILFQTFLSARKALYHYTL